MKKMSLLVISLIVGLPGCGGGGRQEKAQPVRSNAVERHMDADKDEKDIVEVEEDIDLGDEDEDADEEDEEDEEDEQEGEEDEDLEEFDLSEYEDLDDEDLDALLAGLGEEDLDSKEGEEGAFRWIDAQEDDEFKKLYFSFNHYGIREDQKEALRYDIEQVKQLIAESDSSARPTIVLEGHACQEGAPAYNLALSERRAKNVADLFVAAGVDRNSIKVVGRGQECPITLNGRAVNGSREDRAPNRRVEVRVIYT